MTDRRNDSWRFNSGGPEVLARPEYPRESWLIPFASHLRRKRLSMKKHLFALGAVALILTACGSGIDTNSDWDPTANFSGYQTYAWVAGAYESGYGDLVDTRLQAAIEANLNSKGLRKATRTSESVSRSRPPSEPRCRPSVRAGRADTTAATATVAGVADRVLPMRPTTPTDR